MCMAGNYSTFVILLIDPINDMRYLFLAYSRSTEACVNLSIYSNRNKISLMAPFLQFGLNISSVLPLLPLPQ
jgi:hypothetical protein